MKSVCVFCGSHSGSHSDYAASARELGRQLATRQLRLVYGGGGTGLMGELARAALDAGGSVTGVMPHFLVEKEAALQPQPDLRIVHTMQERKVLLAENADAFIALPGGLGTFEELFEVLCHAQLHLHAKPVGLLNTRGYFDNLLRLCDDALAAGFTSPERRPQLHIATTPSELLEKLMAG
jgi:uncharacterized protein (TIGR00730 family)